MELNKIDPKFNSKPNPRIGLITLASDFRIEKDFNNLIYGKDIDLFCNRIKCYNPLTNETLKKMADDITDVTKEILPDQKLDCVAYGCTSGSIAAGYDSIFEKVNKAKPNTKVSTPITAAIKGMKKLGIKNLSIFTPYTSEINDSVADFFNKENFKINENFKRMEFQHHRPNRLLRLFVLPNLTVPKVLCCNEDIGLFFFSYS